MLLKLVDITVHLQAIVGILDEKLNPMWKRRLKWNILRG